MSNDLKELIASSIEARKNILKMAYSAGSASAHVGGALSIIDVIVILFKSILKIREGKKILIERDKFILSKGHGCLAYYSVLINEGFIDNKELISFEKSGSDLMGHPIINKNKGIEFSTGSLAMGLSIGVGLAIAKKIKKTKHKVYVVIGDGECNEGAIWESAMSAYKYNLDNLVVILDKNNFQQTGSTKEIMDTFNLENKWQSFGWDVITIDGHNHQEIFNELKKDNKKDIPKILIANTIKGKGISLFENNNQWHHSVVSKKIFDEAIQELENKNG